MRYYMLTADYVLNITLTQLRQYTGYINIEAELTKQYSERSFDRKFEFFYNLRCSSEKRFIVSKSIMDRSSVNFLWIDLIGLTTPTRLYEAEVFIGSAVVSDFSVTSPTSQRQLQ